MWSHQTNQHKAMTKNYYIISGVWQGPSRYLPIPSQQLNHQSSV